MYPHNIVSSILIKRHPYGKRYPERVLCLSTSRPAEYQNCSHFSTVIKVVQSYEKNISV